MDIFSKEKRSEIMSKIRNKWTKPERVAHSILKGNKIRHKMHPKIPYSPDIFLKDSNTLIFIDGDFWHGRLFDKKLPQTNMSFWRNKIENNMTRDLCADIFYSICGIRVVRIWESQLSSARLLDAAEVR